jgi:hypothetical protein
LSREQEDELHRERGGGAGQHPRARAPVGTPWNTRELRVLDPAGHRLVFTERRAQPDPEAKARWQRLFHDGRHT